jgi:hypothetical protein
MFRRLAGAAVGAQERLRGVQQGFRLSRPAPRLDGPLGAMFVQHVRLHNRLQGRPSIASRNRKPRLSGVFLERMMGLEPTTFCMARIGEACQRASTMVRTRMESGFTG